MAYTISKNSCNGCDICRPPCPSGAITVEGMQYSLKPSLCHNCMSSQSKPQCVSNCPLNCPTPSQPKRGRYKIETRTATSPDLFPNTRNHPFASTIVVWEACNILAQRQSFPWKVDDSGKLYHQRQINGGRGSISFSITDHPAKEPISSLSGAAALSQIEALDIRAACLHLIYAAHATALDRPWEQDFIISDRQIEEYLGLEKRKDLSKATKLTLIKEIAQQPCLIATALNWPQQGQIKGFSLEESRLWHLQEIQHHFQSDAQGSKHLVGLTFKIRAGIWAKYFLNKQGCKERVAFYQYGHLPKSLLGSVMSIWQQHEGAARMMLWLLFKAKMGKEQRITVPMLMRTAYGEEKVIYASGHREERKRLLRTFESDLEVLNHYGLKPMFDPITYPQLIQPLWAKLAELPDDAEAALEFWTKDGSNDTRLTDAAPRGKWNLLMNARILYFELPPTWESPQTEWEKKKPLSSKKRIKPQTQSTLSSEQIIRARKSLQLSQRDLAQMTGKSQSWIRDIENGRFRAKSADQELLRKVLSSTIS